MAIGYLSSDLTVYQQCMPNVHCVEIDTINVCLNVMLHYYTKLTVVLAPVFGPEILFHSSDSRNAERRLFNFHIYTGVEILCLGKLVCQTNLRVA